MLENNFFMSENLAQYVSRIMSEKGLSGYDVERASRKTISQTHTNRIQNGEVTSPSADRLKALAKGLGVPEHELFAVARGLNIEKADLSHERLAAIDSMYKGLPKSQRARVDYLIELVEREVRLLASGLQGVPATEITLTAPEKLRKVG